MPLVSSHVRYFVTQICTFYLNMSFVSGATFITREVSVTGLRGLEHVWLISCQVTNFCLLNYRSPGGNVSFLVSVDDAF